MSFDDAKELMQTYFEDREEQLMQGKRLAWFGQDEEDLEGLLEKFSREDENEEFDELYDESREAGNTMDPAKAGGLRLKIGWLCACLRDLRKQFASGESDPRVALDSVRAALLGCRLGAYKVKLLEEIVKDREKGLGGNG